MAGKTKQEQVEEEEARIRWLRAEVDLAKAVIYQDPSLKLDDAWALIFDLRKRVLKKFPGKEATFDLIIVSRLERVLRERWGSEVDTEVQ